MLSKATLVSSLLDIQRLEVHADDCDCWKCRDCNPQPTKEDHHGTSTGSSTQFRRPE